MQDEDTFFLPYPDTPILMVKPEEKARQQIDRMLVEAGWVVQDRDELNISAAKGVAVREFPLLNGPVDYLLFVNRRAVGVIEAKPEGTTLSGVAEQSEKYLTGVPDNVPHVSEPLPFGYESTGTETYFRDLRDPAPRSRRVFWFHRPEAFEDWLNDTNTLRYNLSHVPPLISEGLRECQIEAITNLEHSFSEDRPRALIQMATGTGKTYTAVTSIYRLIKHCGARRVLFLVDRTNLGIQTHKEFQKYVTPDDGRKFVELYNVQHLTHNRIDPVSKVCISTIQRLYSILKGEEELEEEVDEYSLFEQGPVITPPKEVVYNPDVPIEMFDFIVTDECHRSIYNLWRQVLEYFDAHIIGLTATPSKQTLGFFNKNLVMEYGHDRAVADGVNVGFDVFRIRTDITERGSTVPAEFWVDKRDKLTRAQRWEQLDEDFLYSGSQLDRDVVAKDQIRTVIRTFRDHLFTDLFPGRSEVPKTLIFAKNDSHAEDIVHIVREEFGKGNDFCKKITYRTTGDTPENLIRSFRTSYNPRIAVSVDMISTGVDIRPLECIIFMRDVKSQVYFEQMLGRGTRIVSLTELHQVTTDAPPKARFIVVDAVGVCESSKTPNVVVDRKPGVSFKKLLESVALGNRDRDTLISLGTRLARLDRQIGDKEREEIFDTTDGVTIRDVVNKVYEAVDPDMQHGKANEMYSTATPSEQQVADAASALADEACRVFDSPKFRNLLIDLKTRSEQTIDTVSIDTILEAGFSKESKDQATVTVQNFRQFLEDHKDSITALQIIYSQPYSKRHLTFDQIRELAEELTKPPYHISTEQVWQSYERLERDRVRKASPQRMLTDIISLVRFTIEKDHVLEPYSQSVDHRFKEWLTKQQEKGTTFSPEQIEWLLMIRDHIATSLSIETDDFQEDQKLFRKGGLLKAYQVFGDQLTGILQGLNEALAG